MSDMPHDLNKTGQPSISTQSSAAAQKRRLRGIVSPAEGPPNGGRDRCGGDLRKPRAAGVICVALACMVL